VPLYIKDETAGVLLLTIDNNGLICFGDGTPVNQLSVHGIGVIDENGLVVNGRLGSEGMAPSSGTVTVGPNQSVLLNTLPGIIPTVQLDAYWPNVKMQHVLIPVDHCVSTNLYNLASHSVRGAQAGAFRVFNNTQPSDDGVCTTPITDDVNYRWM
jgi:hypothetical protein